VTFGTENANKSVERRTTEKANRGQNERNRSEYERKGTAKHDERTDEFGSGNLWSTCNAGRASNATKSKGHSHASNRLVCWSVCAKKARIKKKKKRCISSKSKGPSKRARTVSDDRKCVANVLICSQQTRLNSMKQRRPRPKTREREREIGAEQIVQRLKGEPEVADQTTILSENRAANERRRPCFDARQSQSRPEVALNRSVRSDGRLLNTTFNQKAKYGHWKVCEENTCLLVPIVVFETRRDVEHENLDTGSG
jgi:hypothetical protein